MQETMVKKRRMESTEHIRGWNNYEKLDLSNGCVGRGACGGWSTGEGHTFKIFMCSTFFFSFLFFLFRFIYTNIFVHK